MKESQLVIWALLFAAGAFGASTSNHRPVAIVSGGTRGCGSGIAAALADAGYDLLLTYNTNKDAATEFVSKLLTTCSASDDNKDIKIECVGGDISLSSTRDAIFECLDTQFGPDRLRVLVHNAGQYVGITADNSDGLSEQALAFGDGTLLNEDGTTNFDTMHYYQRMYGEAFVDLCERSLARMYKRSESGVQGGSIVGISSPAVNAALYGPGPSYSMPGAGKTLMEYSMRIYAVQAAGRGINVNIVIPGFVQTQAWTRLAHKRGLEDESSLVKFALDSTPVKEPLDPRDVGNVVAFLCSSAGRFITGTVVPYDGGKHLVGWVPNSVKSSSPK